MITERPCGMRLTVKTKNGNYTNSNINLLADPDDMLALAEAVNSLQKDACTQISKSETTELLFFS